MKTKIVIQVGGEKVFVTIPIELKDLINRGGVSLARIPHPNNGYLTFELIALEAV